MRYPFIEQYQEQFPIAVLCRVLQVTRGGYYAWKKRKTGELSARQKENALLVPQIQHFFERSKQTYGSPRIFRDLKEAGYRCGRHRVARLMRQATLRAVVAPRFRATTDSKHAFPVAKNLLDQDFGATEANVKWASDITYIWTREGWLYLAVVLDLFSRRVVGGSMQPCLDCSLVVKALQAALGQRSTATDLVHHSDRGSQYASGEFQQLLCTHGITCSMSRKGNPSESRFRCAGTTRLWRVSLGRSSRSWYIVVILSRAVTRGQARQEVFEYIEVWYNRQRRRSRLGYVSPEAFEQRASQARLMAA